MVTAGSMVANLAAYVLQWRASAWLGPQGYGEFASLLAAQLVLAVPALALQTVVARESVRGKSDIELRRLSQWCAAVVAVLALALSPLVAALLDTAVTTSMAALITAPFLVLLAGEQGLLQGRSRFAALSVLLAGAGLAKVIPAVAVLALGGSTAPALVAGAAGTVAVAIVARLRAPENKASTSDDTDILRWPSVLAASQVQLVIIVLSSVDLVLSRAVLSNEDAGLYAIGAVVTKAAFWLPQSVGVVFYPRLADPMRSARAIRTAVTVLTGIGAAVVIGVLIAAPHAGLILRVEYEPVFGSLWIFAVQGAALAVVQLTLISSVARGNTRPAVIAWVGLGVELVAIAVFGSSVTALAVVAALAAVVTAAAVCAQVMRG